MERDNRPRTTPLAIRTDFRNGADYRLPSSGSVLTDAVLEELKEQSPEGCLLCSLEILDDEEWD